MIRIHFTYRHVDKPWGGANNFIRALRSELSQDDSIQLVETPEAACDIVFMNQLGQGPRNNGQRYRLAQVQRWKAEGRRIVVRAVNLNRHAFRMGLRNLTLGWLQDRQTIALLNLADFVIFQSDYQRSFFVRAGYKGSQSCVIHNGASRAFWLNHPIAPPLADRLRLVSSTASPRETKRHDLIAKLSLYEGVEVTHLGAWPGALPSQRVRLLGKLSSEDMLSVFSGAHYFLHPAIHDPCPNAVFEAVCAGLPVIYNSGPGSSAEIVGSCGISLDENDLAATVQALRSRYPELRGEVLQDRQRFSIKRAISAYCNVFRSVIQAPYVT